MTGWVWAGIFIGLGIALFAIGVPYLITQKGMRSPYDPANLDEADAYLHNKRVFFRRLRRLQREKNAAPAPAGAAGKRRAPRPRASTRQDLILPVSG